MAVKGYLVLSTGDVIEGTWIGATAEAEGELVFNTGMTGYQEVLTDPSYAGQIVTFTYPLIGNYGFNAQDDESARPALAGVLVQTPCDAPSHFRAAETLHERLARFGIPGLCGVDTRALTRLIRRHRAVFGMLTRDPARAKDWRPGPVRGTVARVSRKAPTTWAGDGPHVVVLDFGVKASIIEALRARGCRVTAVPYDTPPEEVLALRPDGLLFSNGPGDPKELLPLLPAWRPVVERIPTMGICLGHQLIALMFGADTERLPYGHRGNNHPVKELATGRVWITAQNHGYVVREESVPRGEFVISHRNVNDGSVEGLVHRRLPILTVQFHPEAHPGPADSSVLFDRFVELCQTVGAKRYA
ncbi:carbamoyl phosphate synthase small subunit [Calditerricola satsumensis]|uniref:Carbamoyl phosphate synthase small chain n=2 Tax=Calditerricola satsumensis TaxID=373054 RepID=A0A8J3B988_9BACI|nr:carbamoyl phosphate synthase small subunit [Calditerricola satsumensis]GGJ94693.1 carbamoyl-phosphate synthase small chain [Calditerricola satsumensis]